MNKRFLALSSPFGMLTLIQLMFWTFFSFCLIATSILLLSVKISIYQGLSIYLSIYLFINQSICQAEDLSNLCSVNYEVSQIP